jgi:hypothetical protein
MATRNCFRLLASLAIALLVLGGPSAGEEKRPREEKKGGLFLKHGAHFQHCAKACADCMRECDSCARHCGMLAAEGKKAHLHSAAICLDCAEICAAAARSTSRHGPLSDTICEGCAKACDRCAANCDKFPDDLHMKQCAKACRDCAKACRDMLNQAKRTADR